MSKQATKRRVGRYSDKIRAQAGIEYAVSGNLSDVERSTGISKSTLSLWHTKGIWDELIEQVRTEKAHEHRQAYSRLVDKSLRAAEAGIDKLEGKDLSPNDIKALVVAGATSTDKVRLADNQPTSIQAKTDSMTSLAQEFARLSRQAIKDEGKVLVPASTVHEHKGPIDK